MVHIPRVPEIVREVLRRVGYPEDRYTLEVLLHRQSPDISAGVTGPLEARTGQAEADELRRMIAEFEEKRND